MSESYSANPRVVADQAFDRARQKVFLENVVSRLRDQPTDLLSYDAVRDILGLISQRDIGLHQIPIDRIVGSVGKYREFSRNFLPLLAQNKERWKGVYTIAMDVKGLPPIDVYQVDEVYFVIDGNHRVSVARQLGATTIEAYVTKMDTPIKFTPDTTLPSLILYAEKQQFLQHTHLAELRPEAKIEATCPGAYKQLEDIIVARGCTYCVNQNCEIIWEEAVKRWYDEGYSPYVEFIRESHILNLFPGNTETDLYLWIMEHRNQFASNLDVDGEMEKLIAQLVRDHNHDRLRNMIRSWLSHPFGKTN
jgi:hypothetical protein